MNGPLLISLLPPERMWDSTADVSGSVPVVAILLLAGILLSFFLRNPER
jgi:hypothetical protein